MQYLETKFTPLTNTSCPLTGYMAWSLSRYREPSPVQLMTMSYLPASCWHGTHIREYNTFPEIIYLFESPLCENFNIFMRYHLYYNDSFLRMYCGLSFVSCYSYHTVSQRHYERALVSKSSTPVEKDRQTNYATTITSSSLLTFHMSIWPPFFLNLQIQQLQGNNNNHHRHPHPHQCHS